MPQLFQLPQVVALSALGVRLPGAKLYFSQTETSTPQNTYQDIDLSTAHENPVEADASGVFAPIYLDPSLPNYRVKLTTSADVQVFQIDDVPANNNEGTDLRITGDAPELVFVEEDAAVNAGKWSIRVEDESLVISRMTDAEVRTSLLEMDRDGNVTPITGSNLVVQSTGSFTLTADSGFASPPSSTVEYVKQGSIVTLFIHDLSGTSNAVTFSLSGFPAAVRPSLEKLVPVIVTDNGGTEPGYIGINAIGSGSVTRADSTPWTSSGTKGILVQSSVTYSL